MGKRVDFQRLYRQGFSQADLTEVAPDLLVLAPIRRPPKMGDIHLTETDRRFEALAFLVVAHGTSAAHPSSPGLGPLRVSTGDIVSIRNALAEPVQPDLGLYVVDVKYVWQVLQRSEDVQAQYLEETESAHQAQSEIELTRAEIIKDKRPSANEG